LTSASVTIKKESSKHVFLITLIGIVAVLVIGIGIGFYFSRSGTEPVSDNTPQQEVVNEQKPVPPTLQTSSAQAEAKTESTPTPVPEPVSTQGSEPERKRFF
jgi:flagellar basal body-associated protein FliL